MYNMRHIKFMFCLVQNCPFKILGLSCTSALEVSLESKKIMDYNSS